MYQAQDMPTTLFIGDLSVTANEESLRNLFGSHNISLNFLKIMKNKSNNSLGYAFVSLESVDQAQYAINTLDGAYLCGRKLRVCFARQFEDLRSNSMSNPTNMNWPQQTSAPSNEHYDPRNSIYFKFLIPVDKASYATTDEGIVRSIFEQKYGPNTVVDVNIRRMAYDEFGKNGYGFIHFSTIDLCKSVLCEMSSFTAGDVVYTMEMSKNLKKQLIEQSTRQYSAGSSSMNNSKPLSAHMNYVQPQHQQSRNDINVDYAKMYGKCNASMQSNVVSNSAYNSGILASRLLSSQQREKHISNPNNNMAPIGPLHINSKYNVSVNPNANINANSLNHDHGQSRLMNSDGSATKNAVDLSQYHFPGSQQQEHMQRTAVPSLHTNSHAMPNIMGQRGAPTWEQSAVGGLNTRRNDVISLRDINSRMTSGPLRTSSMGNILGGVLDLPAYNGTNGQRFARGAHSNSMSDVSGLNGLSLHSLGGNATTLKSGSMKCNDLSLGDLNSNVNANDGSNMPMSNNAFSQYPSVTRETKSLPVSPLYHCQDQNQTESIFNFNFGEYSRDDTSSIPNGGVRNDAYSNAADNCITSGTTTSTDLIYNNGSSEYNTSNPISNFESKVETDAKTLNLRYKQEIDMDSELKDEADFLSKSGVLEGEITMSQNK